MTVLYEDNHIIIVSKSAGEIVQGDKTVVCAVEKGKDAAEAIDTYLGGK